MTVSPLVEESRAVTDMFYVEGVGVKVRKVKESERE